MELRSPFEGDPHRTKKTCFFCRTDDLPSELGKNDDPTVDLMSRRHPLSSIRASNLDQSALMTCRLPGSRQLQKRSYFFFFATLRVFFAVFFTALFAFFAFFAFLAMLPSDV